MKLLNKQLWGDLLKKMSNQINEQVNNPVVQQVRGNLLFSVSIQAFEQVTVENSGKQLQNIT